MSGQGLAQAFVVLMLGALLGCGGSPSPAPNPGTEPPPTNPPPVDPTAGFPITPFTAADGTRFGVQTLVTGLQIPWSLAFTPDGRLLISERPGRVRVYQNGALLPEPALTLTDVFTRDESGILGLAVHPDFATNHFVYLVYTANGPRGAIARLMRFRELDNRLAEGVVLLDDVPASNIHNGSRVKFGPDRRLYVTFGDVARPSLAQDAASLNGKILRLNDDGTSAAGNRFNSPVYSLGHRNPQGIDWHPVSGDLWETEHGQTNNDEINVIDSGANYGWPVIEACRDALRHGDAGHLLRAGRGALWRLVLSRHGDSRVPEPALRRDVAGDGVAARDDRRPPHHRPGAAAAESLRPPARCGAGTRRVPVLLHEQPGWQDDAGGGR